MGARQKIAEALLRDLGEVWEVCGKDVLLTLAAQDPGKLASIAYGLLPRDIFISVQQQPMTIDPEQWEGLVRLAGVMKQIAPDASLDEIEQALRSGFASKLIEAQ